MAHYDQQDVSVVCPPGAVPACVEANPSGPCILAPPPVGYYPTRDTSTALVTPKPSTPKARVITFGRDVLLLCAAAVCLIFAAAKKTGIL